MSQLTQEKLKKLLHYDPKTGLFLWVNVSKYHAEKNGTIAGTINRGYLAIGIDKKSYKAHRLAWLYMTGEWPLFIDHINGDRSDNRFINFRNCTISQNNKNHSKKRNKSNLPCGVRLGSNGKSYQARVRCDGITHYLGSYDTPEKAENVYLKKRKELFGEFHHDHT